MASPTSPTTYDGVVHKKANGSLVLDTGFFRFQTTSNGDNGTTTSLVELPWNKISKHQVSPASHPKSLLKIVLIEGAGKPMTFQLPERSELERIRKDVTERLKESASQHSSLLQSFATPSKPSAAASASLSGTKRKWNHASSSSASGAGQSSLLATGQTTPTSFGELDPTSLAVTRSSLLASNPTLRSQHKYLVEESQTVSEEDFWKTHASLLEEEYARIAGITRAGTSSLLQSHLQVLTGRITLGVEEMRQIFILYPAVHKAYEEKVPLELSDEQFWRKYLESEYFHRDRGRVGAASGRYHGAQNPSNDGASKDPAASDKEKKAAADAKDQEARAAVAAADDLFSRYDQKLRDSGQLDDGVFSAPALGVVSEDPSRKDKQKRKKWGTQLAVGQFDLASTFETERGNLLEGPRDNHPHYNASSTEEYSSTIGAKVIQKYNRHWAMVLNPEEAVAGTNLMEVARHSVQDTLQGDDDALAGGGWDDEMQRLVGFAEANAKDANHALGVGESDEYELLTLKNIGVYYNQGKAQQANTATPDAERTKNAQFANYMDKKMKALLEEQASKKGFNKIEALPLENAFPPLAHGRQLLEALTNRMASDSRTDADTLEVVNSLPVDFKKRLHSYFRRTSELLRHFFGLKRLADENLEDNNAYQQKLSKIVKGLETLYNEIGDMRKEQEVTGTKGKTMGRMCFQIMEQLDWAFKCYREGSQSGANSSSSGGFTTIETF